jgi:hypothetical protein
MPDPMKDAALCGIDGCSTPSTSTPGNRLLNWVWYVHAGQSELLRLLTDRNGAQHHNSLPQGGATDEALVSLRDLARREVHPRLAELVAATPDPFIQTIVDVVVPRTVFGRACLPGATAKAAADAMLLAGALEKSSTVNIALSSFQSAQLRYGNQLHQYGVDLGDRWARPVNGVKQ